MKKKLLFIDRDGTIIKEPLPSYQVNNLSELSFIPGVIRNLYRIANELNFDLVMVTNQDGLGTDTYPESNFLEVQSKMLEILEGEGIMFQAVHVDRSFEHENLDTRKPGIGMLRNYLTDVYDLSNSFVIGDRRSDIELAKNLGAKAIFIKNYENYDGPTRYLAFSANNWDEILSFLTSTHRTAFFSRNTTETAITVRINIDGEGHYQVDTGLGFLNHMVEQLVKHSSINLELSVTGDLSVDEHHTIEDTALVLGKAFCSALGKKVGIERFGFCLPMDDCLAQVAIDFGGRPWLVWDVLFLREKIGDVPTEMFYHFFKSFSDAAKCNLNIKAEGENEHHKIESIFKCFGRAIKQAVHKDPLATSLPSTKGVL